MVLVDTSIWIRAYRQREHPVGRVLWQLAARDEAAVCGAIWLEFIGGFRDARRRVSNARRLDAFPWLETSKQAYRQAAEWKPSVPKLGTVDLIVAATAVEHDAALFTLDAGFATLKAFGLRLLDTAK